MPNRKLRIFFDILGLIIVIVSVWMSSGFAAALAVVSGILAVLALMHDSNWKF